MAYCENCGNKVNSGDRFCGECGAEITGNTKDKEKNDLDYVKHSDSESANVVFKLNWDKRTKIIASVLAGIILLLFIGVEVGKNLTSKDKVIKEFNQAIVQDDSDKLAKLMVSSDPRLKIDKDTLKPFLDYIHKNPSWLSSFITNIKNQASNLDCEDRSSNSLDALIGEDYSDSEYKDISLKKDGKIFFLFGRYVFEVKPYFINVSADLKESEIFINGKSVGYYNEENSFKQFGPYLPGLYEIKATYKGDYASLETSAAIACMDVNASNGSGREEMDVNLNFNPIYLNVSCNYPTATVVINGKDTGISVERANGIGPVNKNTKICVKMNFPWGEISSDEISVGENGYVEFNINGVNNELKNDLMETINKYNLSVVEALIKRDASKVVNASNNTLNSLKSNIKFMKDIDEFYKGKLEKIVYDLDSIEIKQYDGKYYAYITCEEFYDSAYYYKGSTNVSTSQESSIDKYSLIYDGANKKWLIESKNQSWFSDISENTKEFDF